VAWVLSQHENEVQDKRVESVWFPCADEGSTPSSSTNVMIMKAIRFTLFAIAMSALSGLTSCEKAVFDEDGSKTTEESQQETNQGDSTVSKVTLVLRVDVTRAAENSLPWKTLQFEIFDSSYKSVKKIKQNVDDKSCGTASVELAAGTYQVVVLAHSLNKEPEFHTNPIRYQMFTNDDCSDVFYAYKNIVVGDKGQEVELMLNRATSLIRFCTEDVVPQEVKRMTFQCKGGSQTLNLLDGFGFPGGILTMSINVVDSMVGQPLSVELYTFKRSNSTNEIELAVTAYNNNGKVLKTKTYSIPIVRAGISDCSTYFFTDGTDDPEINTGGEGNDNNGGNGGNENTEGGTSFKVKVDTTWTGGVHYYQL